MKRLVIVTIVCLSVIFLTAPIFAQGQIMEYDPLKRNLLTVEGESDKEFPVNIFKLRFGFDIQKGSFSEANAYSAQIIESISKSIEELGLSNVKIVKGWDIVKQAKISIGASGSKISNQLIIEVRDFPMDKMQELIAKIIDSGLAVDKEVYLENVEVGITDELESRYKEEVQMDALKRLKSNAEKAAEAQGKKVVAAKRIFVVSDQGTVAEMEKQSDYMMYQEKAMARKAYISTSKGFTVRSNITDYVKIYARVAGIYEIE